VPQQQQATNTGDQFLGANEFHHVIGCAQLQAGDLLGDPINRREHQDWHACAVALLFADPVAIQLGKHSIQDDQIRVNFPKGC